MAKANWHYLNKNGEKIGPISVAALKTLVEQGLITRETIIVNHTGRTLLAGEVNGLSFPEATQSETAQPETPIETTPEIPSEPEKIQPIAPPTSSIRLEKDDKVEKSDKGDSLAVPPTSEGDVYGLSSPEPATPPVPPVAPPIAMPTPPASVLPAESNPFSASPPDSTNPFSVSASDSNNPFSTSSLDSVNPFSASSPDSANPFSASPPNSTNPFSGSVPKANQFEPKPIPQPTPQPALQRVPVPLANTATKPVANTTNTASITNMENKASSSKGLPKPILFGGIAAVLLLFLVGGIWFMSSSSSPSSRISVSEQTEVDAFLADPETIGKSQDVLLTWQAGLGKLGVVKYLISNGAKVNVKASDFGGCSPLHTAAMGGHLETVKYLVSRGADVHAKTDSGITPLDFAVGDGYLEIVKFLVSKGAKFDVHIINHARQKGHTDVADFLTDPVEAVPAPETNRRQSAAEKRSGILDDIASALSVGKTDKKADCQNNIKQLVIAFHKFYDTYVDFFPALYSVDKSGKPLHSWRVLILPYIEQNELYDQIRLDEPWDSSHNSQFHDRIIDAYCCPANKDVKGKANCTYAVIGGEVFVPGKGKSMAKISDGTSNTVAIVEVKKPFCWMDPTADLTLDEFAEGINISNGRVGSFHSGGCNVGMFDASVRFIFDSTDTKTLRAAGTCAGGETLGL